MIEQDSLPIAILKAPEIKGCRISEVIAALEANGADAVVDEDFARESKAGINAHRVPWDPPSWE